MKLGMQVGLGPGHIVLHGDPALPGAKLTLRPSLALSYIGSITARHSSSGRQPNFAALSRQRDVYSAGRPSGWAFAHILVVSFSVSFISQSCLVSFWLHVNIVNRIVSQVYNA